jgi:hypothetical protein
MDKVQVPSNSEFISLFIYSTVTLSFLAYEVVSLIYSEYTFSIFSCLRLSLHDSCYFNAAVCLTFLFIGQTFI